MKDNKVISVLKYNIKKNLKNKWFIALNVICLIVCIIAINFNQISDIIDKYTNNTIIEIADKEGFIFDKLSEEFSDNGRVEIKKLNTLIYDETKLESNRILLDVKYSDENILELKIISSELISEEYYSKIENSTENVRNQLYADKNNISDKVMNEIIKDVNIETIIIEQSDYTMEQEITYTISVLAIMFAITFVLSGFSKEIFAEKTSKSSEYILTTITAKEYMLIKIGTTFFNILIQGVALLIYCLLGCFIKSLLTTDSFISIITLNSNILKLILLEFILYVPYTIIMLIVQMIMGSKASDSTSSSSTETVSMIIMMITMMLPFYLVQSDLEMVGIIYYFLSCVPMFSTTFLPAIYIYHEVSILAHIIISLITYIITIFIMIKVAPSKIKNGILDYKPTKINKEEEELKEKKKKEKIKDELERRIYTDKISKYSMKIGLAMIIFLVLSTFIFPLTIDPVIYGFFENKISQENITIISSIVSAVLSMYIPAKILGMHNKKETSKSKESKIKWILIAIPFLAIIFTIQTLIVNKLNPNATTEITENTSYLLMFLRLVIVPAVFEELLFRKAVFNSSKKFGLVFAIVISSLLFGAIHLNFYQAIGATLGGVVFAIVAYKTGSLMPSIILHAFVNSYSFFTSVLWANNLLATKLINIVIIGFSTIGLVILIENILKNRNNIKEILKKDNNNKVQNITKLVFTNYYFIFSLILIILCFTINQKYMGMLL